MTSEFDKLNPLS